MTSPTEVNEVRCVLIPLATSSLLLPNAVVAEVTDFQPPAPRKKMPEWFLGDLAWRGKTIPVVSIERMMGGAVAAAQKRSRILVLNTLNGVRSLSHLGLISQSIPTLVRVRKENLEPSKVTTEFGNLIKQPVAVNASLALIPDLDELERWVLEVVS